MKKQDIIDGITTSLKKGDQVSFVGFVPRFSAGKTLRQAVK